MFHQNEGAADFLIVWRTLIFFQYPFNLIS